MKTVDLHTHSTCSDGTFTPRQLMEYASEKKLSAIALTDHDTVEGINEAKFYAKENNIEFISGIEISADYSNHEIHIVGLFIDETNKEFCKTLNFMKEKRLKRNHLIVEKLNSLNMPVTYDDVLAESGGKIITRAHFARLLMKKGYVKSISECFDKYLDDGKPAFVKREVLSALDTINLIKIAGGIAILAHPLYYKLSNLELNKMLKKLSPFLTGMECYYSTHTKEQTNYALGLCATYNLLPSGGSDFHGANKPNLDLGVGYGSLMVNYQVLEKLKEVAKIG